MLKSKAQELLPDLDRARDIIAKAELESRPMTTAEKATVDPILQRSKSITDALRRERDEATIMAVARGMADEIGGPIGTSTTGVKTGQRLSFKGMAAGVATRMLGDNGFGTKSLAPSGATVVAQAFVPDPVALGRAATGLLDILPVRVQTSAEYAFIQQATRTNNAQEVAEGAIKPTTVLGLDRIEQTLAVIAHLSEGVPRYWIADNAALETFVAAELDHGLRLAVEAKVVSDLNGTSGVQTQTFSTSIVETIRKALTKIEVAGYTPGAIALHPADFELIELGVSTANAIEYRGIPFDAASRRLFGVPIATTISATAGVGHVLAADAVVLDVDSQGVQVQWSENSNAEDFARNLIRARVEGRFGTSVLSPLGVVSADLTA